MLKILVLLGSVAFIATIPAIILAFIHLNRFNRFVRLHHPDIGKASVFMLDSMPSISAEGLALGKKARNWLIVMFALFCLFLLCGFATSFYLPR